MILSLCSLFIGLAVAIEFTTIELYVDFAGVSSFVNSPGQQLPLLHQLNFSDFSLYTHSLGGIEQASSQHLAVNSISLSDSDFASLDADPYRRLPSRNRPHISCRSQSSRIAIFDLIAFTWGCARAPHDLAEDGTLRGMGVLEPTACTINVTGHGATTSDVLDHGLFSFDPKRPSLQALRGMIEGSGVPFAEARPLSVFFNGLQHLAFEVVGRGSEVDGKHGEVQARDGALNARARRREEMKGFRPIVYLESVTLRIYHVTTWRFGMGDIRKDWGQVQA